MHQDARAVTAGAGAKQILVKAALLIAHVSQYFPVIMGSEDAKQRKILAGLAAVLGLDGCADDPLAVLKATAETLGCTVADDGTTKLAVRERSQFGRTLGSLCSPQPILKVLGPHILKVWNACRTSRSPLAHAAQSGGGSGAAVRPRRRPRRAARRRRRRRLTMMMTAATAAMGSRRRLRAAMRRWRWAAPPRGRPAPLPAATGALLRP